MSAGEDNGHDNEDHARGSRETRDEGRVTRGKSNREEIFTGGNGDNRDE